MTSQELQKLLQQDAEKKAKQGAILHDNHPAANNYSSFFYGYECGSASLHADICALVDALEYWIEFEEACIKKDGPYVSPEIPKRINKAKEALQKFYSKLEGNK